MQNDWFTQDLERLWNLNYCLDFLWKIAPFDNQSLEVFVWLLPRWPALAVCCHHLPFRAWVITKQEVWAANVRARRSRLFGDYVAHWSRVGLSHRVTEMKEGSLKGLNRLKSNPEEKSVIGSSRRSSQAIKLASRFRISLSNLEATCCNISVFTGLIKTRNTCKRTLTWLDLKTAEVKSKAKEKHLRMWLSLHTLSTSLPFLWPREDPEGWKEGVV